MNAVKQAWQALARFGRALDALTDQLIILTLQLRDDAGTGEEPELVADLPESNGRASRHLGTTGKARARTADPRD